MAHTPYFFSPAKVKVKVWHALCPRQPVDMRGERGDLGLVFAAKMLLPVAESLALQSLQVVDMLLIFHSVSLLQTQTCSHCFGKYTNRKSLWKLISQSTQIPRGWEGAGVELHHSNSPPPVWVRVTAVDVRELPSLKRPPVAGAWPSG